MHDARRAAKQIEAKAPQPNNKNRNVEQKLIYGILNFYQNFVRPLYKDYKKSITTGLILFFGFLVLEPFINNTLDALWVKKVLALFHPSDLFDIFSGLVIAVIIYKNYTRRPTAWDFLFFLIYVKWRFFRSYWAFDHPFASHSWSRYSLAYIDVIGIYFILMLVYSLRLSLKKPPVTLQYADGYFNSDMSLDKQAEKTNTPITELDRLGLNRNKFAAQLAEAIKGMRPYSAFAIGISGSWGTGKTSLMELLIANLKNSENNTQFLYVEFSPWFFANSDALITSFFSAIESKFRSNRRLASELKAYGKEIAMVEKSLFKTEFSKLFLEKEKSLKERYVSIIEEIQKENKILIVTIDDLDRLDSKEIVEILRLIRLIADFPNTFYIVGYDRDYINAAIEKEVTKYNPNKFLDKVFNTEFKIPEMRPDIIKDRLKMVIEEQLSRIEIKTDHGPFIEKCFEYPKIHKFLRNERDIKRFSNNLIIRYLSIKEEINFHHLFLLELINYLSPNFFSEIYERKDELFSEFEPKTPDGKEKNSDIKNVFHTPTHAETMEIITELWDPRNKHVAYSISNELYFHRYFSLALFANDFSSQDFQAVLDQSADKIVLKLSEFDNINSVLLQKKLNSLFHDISSIDKKRLEKIIEALLLLYDKVFNSDELVITGELTLSSLEDRIYGIVGRLENGLELLKDKLIHIDIPNNLSFVHLIRAKNLGNLASFIDDLTEIGKRYFKEMQLMFLEKDLKKQSGLFNRTTVARIRELAAFTRVDYKEGPFSQTEATWFHERVILNSKKVILENFGVIIEYVKKESLIDGKFDLPTAQIIVDSIFADQNLSRYKNDQDFDKLLDLYNGYESSPIFGFSFVNQIPPPGLAYEHLNDHTVPKVFELKPGSKIEIVITPNYTPYWRFGFRLSRIKEFQSLTDGRHVDRHPFIHLNKGVITNGVGTDLNPPRLDLAIYTGENLLKVEPFVTNYENTVFILSLERMDGGELEVCVSGLFSARPSMRLDEFADFHYLQISAWADLQTFNISGHIKELSKIK
jgi:Cdc6-like AAA superfamily ATPase